MKDQNTRFILISCFIAILACSSMLMSLSGVPQDGKLTVIVDNVKSSEGSIAIGLYTNQASFSKEQPYKKLIIPKKDYYKNKQVIFDIPLPKGTYGIALLDDENDNRKMDYSFALPKEGYGFSNYKHKGWSRPNFDNFDFYHNGQQSTVKITVQYW